MQSEVSEVPFIRIFSLGGFIFDADKVKTETDETLLQTAETFDWTTAHIRKPYQINKTKENINFPLFKTKNNII